MANKKQNPKFHTIGVLSDSIAILAVHYRNISDTNRITNGLAALTEASDNLIILVLDSICKMRTLKMIPLPDSSMTKIASIREKSLFPLTKQLLLQE